MTTYRTAGPVTWTGEPRNLIGGRLVEAQSGRRFPNVNPATEDVLGEVADAGQEDMDEAISAARLAFDETSWSTDRELRKRCLIQLQAALASEREQLRAEVIAEVGSPIAMSYGPHLDIPIDDALTWPAEMIDRFSWERALPDNRLFGTVSRRVVMKEPVGVVGAIVPWNVPVEVTLGKLGPILATGNTVVLKPAPDTPFNGTRLGRLVAEATDIPPGVVNVVTTSDNAIAERLVTDPRVDQISFTGSTGVGRRIMELGGRTLKRLFLELGGKSATIYLDDADLEATLPVAAFGACTHAGQGCCISTRLLLPRSQYDQALEIVADAFRSLPYGDPTDMRTVAGPLINARQRDRVLGYLDRGRQEGARVVVGGGRPAHLESGFYVEPTLFADVDNQMAIAREEIFGPVLVAIPYDDDDDAVRIANDSPYGLGGEVWSASEDRAMAVTRRLRTGTVGVNGGVWYGAETPFGGYKSSGIGRQNGVEGFEQYLETKAVGIGGKS